MAIFSLSVVAWLPFVLRMKIGSVLGYLTFLFARERRYITRINIELCFPELDVKDREQLVRDTFIENGIGLIETATGWVRPASQFRDLLMISGAHHMEAALAKGKGVLMLGAHYTTLDFSANLLSQHFPFAVTYRAHNNALFDAFMLRGRLRNCNGVFDRKDIRGAFKHLREGKILWYAPDQDYGPEQAVYAPFFGKPAATITATSRFAAFNNSPVVLVRHHRHAHKPAYVIEFIPVPEPFPGVDDSADTTLINHMIEKTIRMEPAQYLWMHKRFKTQPGGKPQSPYINIRTTNKKLSETQYQQVLGSAQASTGQDADSQKVVLQNGLQLWHFPGLCSGLKKISHPASKLDTVSKHLRSNGLNTVTIDNIFRIKSRNLTAVSCFVPAGVPLEDSNAHQIAPIPAAFFFTKLHAAGYYCRDVGNGNLLVSDAGLAILDPLALHKLAGGNDTQQRCDDLLQLATLQQYSAEEFETCCNFYLANISANKREAVNQILPRLLAQQQLRADNASDKQASPASNETSSSSTS